MLWTIIKPFLNHAIISKVIFMNPIELGKFIASLRAEKNLTQEELAEILFIDKRKVSRWECGTSTPEFDMLIKLSEILDVLLYELSMQFWSFSLNSDSVKAFSVSFLTTSMRDLLFFIFPQIVL